MALRNVLILRKPPTGPASGRPEDRLRGCLEGRMALIQPIANSFTRSDVSGPEIGASREPKSRLTQAPAPEWSRARQLSLLLLASRRPVPCRQSQLITFKLD